MTTLTKSILAFVGAVVIAGFIWGVYQYPKAQLVSSGSPAGTTFNSAKVAETVMVPIGRTATSSSILNGDASDRIVDSSFVSCATSSGSVYDNNPQSTGVATWNWQFATTAVASQGLQGNTNYAANMTMGTSTTDNSYTASSTNPVLVISRTWKAGSYMTYQTNATSTNQTIQCQVGVYYHGS